MGVSENSLIDIAIGMSFMFFVLALGANGHFPALWSWQFPLKVLGILLTSAAVALGAPFWFDALSKLGSLRSSGPPPKATNTR
jgi:hypothetical protein